MTSPPLLLAIQAMATRFELLLHGDDPVRLRAAGDEALAAIARIERQLSFYRVDSEVAAINTHAWREPVRVSPEVFRLLDTCAHLTRATGGAFDVTIGPLMRAWRFVEAHGGLPAPGELEAALAVTGMALVRLDPDAGTVRFERAGAAVDLGSAGKGYAVDVAIDVLREAGVTSALLRGGAGTVHVIGTPPGADAWPVEWHAASGARAQEPHAAGGGAAAPTHDAAHAVPLRNSALSVSAVHGKSFVRDGREYGHVIDPRTGEPAVRARSACVTGPSSLLCDALSTALLVNGGAWLPTLRQRWPGYEGWVA